jgi:hypothetical protein
MSGIGLDSLEIRWFGKPYGLKLDGSVPRVIESVMSWFSFVEPNILFGILC